MIFRERLYLLDVRVDPAKELARPAVVVLLVREQRIFSHLSEQIPHKERVALRPACLPSEHLLPVRFIEGKFAAEVADVRVVCLFEVEIAREVLLAIEMALCLERIEVEPASVQGT
ncbi:MAG: hypothetical protein ACXVDN_11650 [Ktedonobacteraceae bacterium]